MTPGANSNSEQQGDDGGGQRDINDPKLCCQQ